MKYAIMGDTRALRDAFLELARHVPQKEYDAVMRCVEALDRGEDEPKPTAKADEEQDYTCPICGKEPANEDGRPLNLCQHGSWSSLAAANRRIKALERERDEMEKLASLWNDKFTKACARADSAYAKGAEDFRESVAKALQDELGTTSHWAIQTVRTHPIPKPKETQE